MSYSLRVCVWPARPRSRRRASEPLRPVLWTYSPECVEGEFSEVLRSCFASCPRPEALPLVGDPCLPLEGAPPTTARTRWHATSTSSCSDGCVPPVASACTDAPIASPGGQPTPGLARWAYSSSVARRTHSRTPRRMGGPQACVWPPRRPRGRPPSRRSESWGCTSTSVPSFPKGRSHLCTRCYESETVAGGWADLHVALFTGVRGK